VKRWLCGDQVPGHHRDTGGDRPIDRRDAGGWVVARDRDAIDAACDQIIHHARLLDRIGGDRPDR
jgi:hypothetical protein